MNYSLNSIIIDPNPKKLKKNLIILCHGYGGVGKDISFIANYWKKFLQETNTSYDNLYIQAWANLTTKNQKILRHKHSNTFLNGHIAINAEPSSTIYSIDGDSYNVDIINQNGQIVIAESDLSHSTSIWELDQPRTTIAFEIVRNIKNHHEIAFSNFHPLYLE